MIRNVEDEGDVGGLDRVGRFRGDGGGEDSEGVGFDEGVEGGDVGFGVGGAEIHFFPLTCSLRVFEKLGVSRRLFLGMI